MKTSVIVVVALVLLFFVFRFFEEGWRQPLYTLAGAHMIAGALIAAAIYSRPSKST